MISVCFVMIVLLSVFEQDQTTNQQRIVELVQHPDSPLQVVLHIGTNVFFDFKRLFMENVQYM